MFTYKNCLKQLAMRAFFLLSSSVCDDVACKAEREPRVWVPGLVCTSQVHGRAFLRPPAGPEPNSWAGWGSTFHVDPRIGK